MVWAIGGAFGSDSFGLRSNTPPRPAEPHVGSLERARSDAASMLQCLDVV